MQDYRPDIIFIAIVEKVNSKFINKAINIIRKYLDYFSHHRRLDWKSRKLVVFC